MVNPGLTHWESPMWRKPHMGMGEHFKLMNQMCILCIWHGVHHVHHAWKEKNHHLRVAELQKKKPAKGLALDHNALQSQTWKYSSIFQFSWNAGSWLWTLLTVLQLQQLQALRANRAVTESSKACNTWSTQRLIHRGFRVSIKWRGW